MKISPSQLPLQMGRGLTFHVASLFLMASIPVLNKMSVSCVTPIVAAFLTNSLVCLWASFGMLLLSGRKKHRIPFKYILPIGVLNSMAMMLLFYAVCSLLPYEVAFLSRSYILFAFLIGFFLLGERFSSRVYPLMAFIIIGSVLVTYQEGGHGDQYYLGVAAALTGPLCYALSSYFIKKLDKNISVDYLMFCTHGMSIFVMLPLAWPWLVSGAIFTLNLQDFYPIFLNSFLGIYLGVRSLTVGLTLLPLTTAGIMRAFTPMITLFYCSLLEMDIKLSLVQAVGCVLLLSSGFFLLKRD